MHLPLKHQEAMSNLVEQPKDQAATRPTNTTWAFPPSWHRMGPRRAQTRFSTARSTQFSCLQTQRRPHLRSVLLATHLAREFSGLLFLPSRRHFLSFPFICVRFLSCPSISFHFLPLHFYFVLFISLKCFFKFFYFLSILFIALTIDRKHGALVASPQHCRTNP